MHESPFSKLSNVYNFLWTRCCSTIQLVTFTFFSFAFGDRSAPLRDWPCLACFATFEMADLHAQRTNVHVRVKHGAIIHVARQMME